APLGSADGQPRPACSARHGLLCRALIRPTRTTHGKKRAHMRPHDIITAAPLSFDSSGALDLTGTRAILEYVAASGVQGALVLGTTGEFPALSIEERNTVAALAVEVLGDQRVIVHVGAASR